jgi:mRNA interferase MazF
MPPRVVRGEVWLVELGCTRGREVRGRRPCIVVSVNVFNDGPTDLVVVLPLTTRYKGYPLQTLHVTIEPPEGGVNKRTFAKSEDVRSISASGSSGGSGSCRARPLPPWTIVSGRSSGSDRRSCDLECPAAHQPFMVSFFEHATHVVA